MSLVLDASATLAWVYEEDATIDLDRLYRQVQQDGAVVPQLWRLEIVNILLMNARKGRHDLDFVTRRLLSLRFLEISIDSKTQLHAWDRTAQLAVKHGLTSYDASYLELAMRLRLPLATLDKQLIRAARTEGVSLF